MTMKAINEVLKGKVVETQVALRPTLGLDSLVMVLAFDDPHHPFFAFNSHLGDDQSKEKHAHAMRVLADQLDSKNVDLEAFADDMFEALRKTSEYLRALSMAWEVGAQVSDYNGVPVVKESDRLHELCQEAADAVSEVMERIKEANVR